MAKAVCPGSFDPVTNGHVDIITRAADCFDEVVVALGVNESKQGLFSVDERLEFLRSVVADLPGVSVASFRGLLVEFCLSQDARTVVKGLRVAGDFDYEQPMAQMNRHLGGIETVFLPASGDHGFVSSSLVKEVAALGGDVSALVPPVVRGPLHDRLGR